MGLDGDNNKESEAHGVGIADKPRKSIPPWKAGPLGLGDPEDRSLRRVETEVLIPMKMRDKGKERCSKEVEEFTKCCKESSIAMVVHCRQQNSALKSCLTSWYQNEDFKQECTEEFLKERTEYRRTGIKKKQKKYQV